MFKDQTKLLLLKIVNNYADRKTPFIHEIHSNHLSQENAVW